MVADVRLSGVEGFAQLSRALKDAGRGETRKELNRRLKDAVKPVIPKTRAEAMRRLPQSGGLAKRVAKAPQRVQVKTGATTAGVKLVVGNSRSGARGANRGAVRHPLFGDRDHWYTTKVPSGWFDDPANAAKPSLIAAAEDALQSICDDIAREVR